MKIIKPITINCIILLTVTLTAFGQKIITHQDYLKNKVFIGDKMADTTQATPEEMSKVHTIVAAEQLSADHYYYDFPYVKTIGIRFVSNGNNKSEIYEGNGWGENNQFKSIIIAGDCGIEVSALDINEKNAANYRYHVVQNDDKELVSWAKPSNFRYTTDGKLKYAYLGKFDYTPGQVIKIEIYNVKDYRNFDAVLIDWRKVEAANVNSFIQYLSKRDPLPDNGLYSKGLSDTARTVEYKYTGNKLNGKLIRKARPVQLKDFIETTSPNDIRFRTDDSVQNLKFLIMNGGRLYNYKVSLTREINGKKDSLNLGEVNKVLDIYKELWKNPGKYQIIFTPKIHKHGGTPIKLLRNLATNISFTVLPPLDSITSIPIKTVALIIIILLTICGVMFVTYRSNQRRKLAKEAQNKQIATLQLQSVRAQLNPHFIFNALAGIQNLMNKNAVEDANKYLTRFARLTRNVLDDGQKELTTIAHETALLNDYLQMEQLRFSFKFNIDTNEVDPQIEIPAMLLQPFVENAVKHGVSALKEQGIITIDIIKRENNVILSVADNGKGFSNDKIAGMGIKLCEERIRLLNSIYKNINIVLNKKSDNNGTLITIELNNWLQ